MDRRSFVRTSVGVSLCCLPLAGCAQLAGSQVDEEIDRARGDIEDNEETFENVATQFERGETPGFDPEQIRTRASRADETLAEVEGDAPEDQRALVGALRDWTDFQRRRADVLDLVIRLQSKWDAISSHLQAEQIEEARTALDEAETIYEDLQAATDDVEAAYEEVDREALAADGLRTYDEEIRNFLANIRDWLAVMDVLFAGMAPLLDGFAAYQDATTAYDDEQFDSAAETFGGAQTDFAVAEREFEGLRDHSTEFPTLEAGTVEMICVAGSLDESAGLMQESARAAADGRFQEANDLSTQAVEAAEQCDFE